MARTSAPSQSIARYARAGWKNLTSPQSFPSPASRSIWWSRSAASCAATGISDRLASNKSRAPNPRDIRASSMPIGTCLTAERKRDELGGMVLPADGNDDVLRALVQVRHQRAGGARIHLVFPDNRA